MTSRPNPFVALSKSAIRILLTIAYVLVFAEVFTRLFAPQPVMPRFVTGSSYGVRANIAGAVYRHETEEVSVEVRISSQGFRADKVYAAYPEPGTCRIAIFGDSFFMGYETQLEHSFAGLLEKQLAMRDVRAEVLNFAVSGFGTAENLVVLREHALSFHPDVILFEWQETDFADNVRSGLYKLEDGVLARDATTYLPAIELRDSLMKFFLYRWLISNSQFYSAIREASAGMVKNLLLLRASGDGGKSRQPASGGGKNAPRQADVRAELSVALLREAYEVAKKRNIEFAVVEIPRRISRTRFVSSIDRIEHLLPAEISVVKSLDVFMDHADADTKIYYEKGAGHLTPLGNSLLADSVANAIRDRSITENCNSRNSPD